MTDSTIIEGMKIIAEGFITLIIELSKQHGILISLLAVLGIISIIAAAVQYASKTFKYLFYFCIAVPLIVVFGLIGKVKRKERIKELGEIVAHVKQKYELKKLVLYWMLFIIITLLAITLIWWFIANFILPFNAINDYSKIALQNYTYNTSLNISK
jgi:hypothetical protein